MRRDSVEIAQLVKLGRVLEHPKSSSLTVIYTLNVYKAAAGASPTYSPLCAGPVPHCVLGLSLTQSSAIYDQKGEKNMLGTVAGEQTGPSDKVG